jgi:hypothetical protein
MAPQLDAVKQFYKRVDPPDHIYYKPLIVREWYKTCP